MQHLPELADIAVKLEHIIGKHVDLPEPMPKNKPLVAELGFDSLDLIEASFSIQEYFDFDFSDTNALDALDKALGPGKVVHEGKLTALGRELALERMPELRAVTLPESLSPMDLQRYFTLETFARLIREFLVAIPDICPITGERVVLDAMRPRTEITGKTVTVPDGETLLNEWVETVSNRYATA